MAEGFTIDPDALRRGLDDAVWPAIAHFQDTCTQFGYIDKYDYDLTGLVGSAPDNAREFANLWMQAYHELLKGRNQMVKTMHSFGETLEHVYQIYTETESKNAGIIARAGEN